MAFGLYRAARLLQAKDDPKHLLMSKRGIPTLYRTQNTRR